MFALSVQLVSPDRDSSKWNSDQASKSRHKRHQA
jgi:hypothetical protein